MKKLFYSAVLCSLLAFSCNKSNDSYDGLSGTWELVEIQAGMTPQQNPPAGTEKLILTSTHYEIHRKDAPVQKGTFSVVADSSVEKEVCLEVKEGQYTHRVILEGGDNDRKLFFQINGKELLTLSGCFAVDGGVYKKYTRTGPAGKDADQ